MSVTVSTCQGIHNSPLNTSISKNLWTFSKQSRFEQSRSVTSCAVAFYDLPDVKEKRTAGIGKGSKYDFTKDMPKTPAPNIYEQKGDIELNRQKNKGFQFGVSRDKMMQTSILGNLNKSNPGPGKYDLGSTLSQTKYSFRPKLNDDLMVTNKYVPGPGAYTVLPSINEKGKYPVSQFRNSGATVINPARSKRFVDNYETMAPGPGNYPIDKTGIQRDGKYFVSTMHSSGCRSFPHEIRRTGSMGHFEKTPGPGSYKLPSDFGHYQSAQSVRTSQVNE